VRAGREGGTDERRRSIPGGREGGREGGKEGGEKGRERESTHRCLHFLRPVLGVRKFVRRDVMA